VGCNFGVFGVGLGWNGCCSLSLSPHSSQPGEVENNYKRLRF